MEEISVEKSQTKTEDREISTKPKNYFPSAEVMLSVIQKEYEYESERVRSLETRTGIFLTFAGALLVFISSSVKLPDLKKMKINSVYEAFPFILSMILMLLTMVILIIAVILFVRVISTQTYKRLAFKGFIEKNTREEVDVISKELMIDYQKVVIHNNEVNNKKVEIYKKGVYSIMIAIIMTAIIYSINFFI